LNSNHVLSPRKAYIGNGFAGGIEDIPRPDLRIAIITAEP
jgi:hypothetical protein